jgi:hypothetical protein
MLKVLVTCASAVGRRSLQSRGEGLNETEVVPSSAFISAMWSNQVKQIEGECAQMQSVSCNQVDMAVLVVLQQADDDDEVHEGLPIICPGSINGG